jgi:hypothetical protein
MKEIYSKDNLGNKRLIGFIDSNNIFKFRQKSHIGFYWIDEDVLNELINEQVKICELDDQISNRKIRFNLDIYSDEKIFIKPKKEWRLKEKQRGVAVDVLREKAILFI